MIDTQHGHSNMCVSSSCISGGNPGLGVKRRHDDALYGFLELLRRHLDKTTISLLVSNVILVLTAI